MSSGGAPTPAGTSVFKIIHAVYEDLTKFQEVKKFMEEQLQDYNMEPGIIPMGLVLFWDAIEHGTVSSVLYIILFSVFTINKGVITAWPN